MPPPLNMWWVVLRLHVHRSMINIPASHLYLFSLSALTFTMITLPCSWRLWRNVLLKGTRCTICVQRGEKSSRSFLIMMISSFWSCYSCCCCYSNIVSLFTSQQHCFNFPALFCCYFSNVAIIEFHNRNIGWWPNWNQSALMWPISSFIEYRRMWAGGSLCQIWYWFVDPKRALNFERTRGGRILSTMTGLFHFYLSRLQHIAVRTAMVFISAIKMLLYSSAQIHICRYTSTQLVALHWPCNVDD